MTAEQFDRLFNDAVVIWGVAPERIGKLRPVWEDRFRGLDFQTFNFTLRRAEQEHTRYLPTIPQIMAIYRDIDREATNRERNNRLAAERGSASEDRELTASECHREAEFFARRAAEIHAEQGGRDRTAFARWFERLAEYYARQAPRVASGLRMEPTPKLTDVLQAMGIDRPDPRQEARRQAQLDRERDAEAYAA